MENTGNTEEDLEEAAQERVDAGSWHLRDRRRRCGFPLSIFKLLLTTRQYFIRYNAAAQIANRMQFLGEDVEKASGAIVQLLEENEGLGGVIALDSDGNCMFLTRLAISPFSLLDIDALPMNSTGMYRGVITAEEIPRVAIFSDEELA